MDSLTSLALFGGSLGAGEILLVLVVALILFGSKNLPRIARNLGKAMEEFRRAARQVSDEILHGDEHPTARPDQLPPEKPKENEDSGDDKAG